VLVSVSIIRLRGGICSCLHGVEVTDPIGIAAEAASVGVIWERGAIVGVSAVIES
jgi:hypothetical protein